MEGGDEMGNLGEKNCFDRAKIAVFWVSRVSRVSQMP